MTLPLFEKLFYHSDTPDGFLSLSEEDKKVFYKYISEILSHPEFISTDNFLQHGETSCYMHSFAVSYYCLVLARKLKWFSWDEKSLSRGALLHDYFLYDWHCPYNEAKMHGFTHPKKALQNAFKSFEINQIEADIIKRHMFPLTIMPPKFKESILVCIVDKLCSTAEILKAKPYRKFGNKLVKNQD